MTSKFLLDVPKTEPVKFDYRGLIFWLEPEPSTAKWNKVRIEQMTKHGVDEAELGGMDDEGQSRWYGKAMATVLVQDIEPFEIENEDGSIAVFDFNGPSDMDVYETQGQELLGENTTMQNEVFNQIMRIANNKPDYEVRALGKSSQPADSGE